MLNMAAIMASQTAMRVSTQFACQKMRERQKEKEKEEAERKNKEEKK